MRGERIDEAATSNALSNTRCYSYSSDHLAHKQSAWVVKYSGTVKRKLGEISAYAGLRLLRQLWSHGDGMRGGSNVKRRRNEYFRSSTYYAQRLEVSRSQSCVRHSASGSPACRDGSGRDKCLLLKCDSPGYPLSSHIFSCGNSCGCGHSDASAHSRDAGSGGI